MNWLYVAGGVAAVGIVVMILLQTGAFALSPEQCYEKYNSQVQQKEISAIPQYSDYYPDSNCNAIRITDYYESNFFKYHDIKWHLKEGVQSAPAPDPTRMQQIQQIGIQKGIQGLQELAKLCALLGC